MARATAGLLDEVPDRDWLGYSFETLILNELRMRNHVSHQDRRIMYYKVHSGREVDFVIEIKKGTLRSIPEVILLEVKYSKAWKSEWEKEINDLARSEKIKIKAAYGVYVGHETLARPHLMVLPVVEFLKQLHEGRIF